MGEELKVKQQRLSKVIKTTKPPKPEGTDYFFYNTEEDIREVTEQFYKKQHNSVVNDKFSCYNEFSSFN